MYKKLIEKHLNAKLSEAQVPGISITKKAQDESGDENEDAMKDVSKKMEDYEDSSAQEDTDSIEPPKRNLDDKEKEFHEDYEDSNGMEQLRYDGSVGDKFKDRAEKAIAGDPTMGNDPKWANVYPEQQGFSGPEFGKKLAEKIKRAAEKRTKAVQAMYQFGDDIETATGDAKITKKNAALESVKGKKVISIEEDDRDPGKNARDMFFRNKTSKDRMKEEIIQYVRNSLEEHGHDTSKLSDDDIYDIYYEIKHDFPRHNQYDDSESIDENKSESNLIMDIRKEFNVPKGGDIKNVNGQIYIYYYGPNKTASNWANSIKKKYGKKFVYVDTSKIKEQANNKSQIKETNGEDEIIEWKQFIKVPYSEVRKVINKYYKQLKDHHFAETKDSDVTLIRVKGEKKLIDKIKKELKNNKSKIKENKMKRLKFKKPFNGRKNALKLIPEQYKVDNKIFEMTDGIETYKIRWEENSGVILESKNQNKINEDVDKMKHLMGYNSRETFGNLKGKERIEENSKMKDFMGQTKNIIGEDEEGNKILNLIREHDNETTAMGQTKVSKDAKESEPGEEDTGASEGKGDADEYVEDKKGKDLSKDKPKEIDPATGLREGEDAEDEDYEQASREVEYGVHGEGEEIDEMEEVPTSSPEAKPAEERTGVVEGGNKRNKPKKRNKK